MPSSHYSNAGSSPAVSAQAGSNDVGLESSSRPVSLVRDDLDDDPVPETEIVSEENAKRFKEFTLALKPLCSDFHETIKTIWQLQHPGMVNPVWEKDKSEGSITAPIQWEVDDPPKVLDLTWRVRDKDDNRDGEAVQRGFRAIEKFETANNTNVSSTKTTSSDTSVFEKLFSAVRVTQDSELSELSQIKKLDHEGILGYEQTFTTPDGSIVFSWREDLERVRVKVFLPEQTGPSAAADEQRPIEKEIEDQVGDVPHSET